MSKLLKAIFLAVIPLVGGLLYASGQTMLGFGVLVGWSIFIGFIVALLLQDH